MGFTKRNERRQREKDRRREEKRREKKPKFREAGTLDPMDPSSYSECPRYAFMKNRHLFQFTVFSKIVIFLKKKRLFNFFRGNMHVMLKICEKEVSIARFNDFS